jgi:DNA-binding SARP family transcriptional activator/EAL domain-containing protein (putative c-di-GMP-specific phosphodiesterase class I)
VSSPGTRIALLGRLSIDRDDGLPASARLSGWRSELVFAYLAAEHRRTVSRDELADALWPGQLPDSWAAALRGVVSDVRRFLDDAGLDPGELLVSEHGGYRLRLPDRVAVDLDEARDALASARERLAAGEAAAAAAQAERASELARLPFLPRHEGDWVDGIRRELDSVHVRALELQARAQAQAGDPRAAASAAERLVRAEPFSEAAHRLRIELLAAAGDRAGAIKAYEHCRTTLDRELGVEPSDETQAALRRALGRARGRSAGDEPADAPAAFAGYSVLVVEDHDFQRRTAVALLRGLGVGDVAEAPDGTAALAALADAPPPDVIICDIDMPRMDGVEFIRHVAERGLAGAVVIASGLEHRVVHAAEAVSEGYGLQVLGAVEKPLTARRLGELLGGYRRAPSPTDGERDDAAARVVVDALEQGRIVARFQPIVDLTRGRVSGAEAVPWGQNAAAPANVVSVLQAEGLIEPFVARLVELACSESQELAGAGLAIEVWIRIPEPGLADIALADRLGAIVRERDADARQIVCALDARFLRRAAPAALDVLTRLRLKGFGLCLDDFTAGHASIEQLDRVPLTGVRLSAALVSGASGDPGRVAAIEQALELAGTLDLPAVACGCDTAADFELLLRLGCRHAQGAFIAEPMAGAELPGWAGRWSPSSEIGGSP